MGDKFDDYSAWDRAKNEFLARAYGAGPAVKQTGRGDTGRPRNFKAMSFEKLRQVYYTVVVVERNDPQCVALLQNERDRRRLVDPGNGQLMTPPKDEIDVILDSLADF